MKTLKIWIWIAAGAGVLACGSLPAQGLEQGQAAAAVKAETPAAWEGNPIRQGYMGTEGLKVEFQAGGTPVSVEEIPGYARKDPSRENRYVLTMRLTGMPAKGSFDAMLRETPADIVGPLEMRQKLMRSRYVVEMRRADGGEAAAGADVPQTLTFTLAARGPEELQAMARAVVRVCDYSAWKQRQRGLREELEGIRGQLAKEEAGRREEAARAQRLLAEEEALERRAAALPKFKVEELQRKLAALEMYRIGAQARLGRVDALDDRIGHDQTATRQRDVIQTIQTIESVRLAHLRSEERALRAALAVQERLTQLKEQAESAAAQTTGSPTATKRLEDRAQELSGLLRQPYRPLKVDGPAEIHPLDWTAARGPKGDSVTATPTEK